MVGCSKIILGCSRAILGCRDIMVGCSRVILVGCSKVAAMLQPTWSTSCTILILLILMLVHHPSYCALGRPIAPYDSDTSAIGCSDILVGCSRVILGCSNILVGCSRVILGCSNILVGCSRVILGCSDVLVGCSRIILGCSDVLVGCSEVAARLWPIPRWNGGVRILVGLWSSKHSLTVHPKM